MTQARRLGAALAALASLDGAAAAADLKMPPDLPPYGQDKPLPVPQIIQHTLANGLQVWVVPRQGLPRVDFVIAVRGAGFGADAPTQPGFASLLAEVLTEGTAQRDSRAIAEAAQGLGGAIGAGSGNDGITVNANALPSQAATMLALLAEVARSPAYPDKEVALAKTHALQSLKSKEATPRLRAERALAQAVFGDHAYGRTLPTAESNLRPLHLDVPATWTFDGSKRPIEGKGPQGEKVLISLARQRPGAAPGPGPSARDVAKGPEEVPVRAVSEFPLPEGKVG